MPVVSRRAQPTCGVASCAANVMAVIAKSRENNGSTHNTTVSSPKASWPMQ